MTPRTWLSVVAALTALLLVGCDSTEHTTKQQLQAWKAAGGDEVLARMFTDIGFTIRVLPVYDGQTLTFHTQSDADVYAICRATGIDTGTATDFSKGHPLDGDLGSIEATIIDEVRQGAVSCMTGDPAAMHRHFDAAEDANNDFTAKESARLKP